MNGEVYKTAQTMIDNSVGGGSDVTLTCGYCNKALSAWNSSVVARLFIRGGCAHTGISLILDHGGSGMILNCNFFRIGCQISEFILQ